MNLPQRVVALVCSLLFVVVLLFPPHVKEGLYYRDGASISGSSEWVFRSAFAPATEEYETPPALAEEYGRTVAFTEYERMTTEWFALIGFVVLAGIGAALVVKD